MKIAATPRRKRHYVAAMVLGTALSALGSSPASARAAAPGISEGDINHVSRYCTACWRNARVPVDRWGDCTQEVLSRLLARVGPEGWGQLLAHDSEERRELIRAIDAVKKRTLRDARRSTCLQMVVADHRHAVERDRSEARQAVARASTEVLSQRQQQIMHMSFDGSSVQDIASALSVPAERISDEKYKAIRKLREHFRTAGM